MSFSFASLFSFAKTVLTDVAAGEKAIAPVASVIPGAGAVLTAAQGVTTAVSAVIDAGESAAAALGPEAAQVETWLDALFHIDITPGAIVLTPKTSVATVTTASAASLTASVS
jgi:hypothetical protein